MPSPVITPNMSLTEPAIGSTLSPGWAMLLNNNFVTIDQHDHTPGNGVSIPPAGLNINSDLTFQRNNLLDLNSAVFGGSVVGTPSVLSIYSNGTDFFFKDISGNSIQLTKAGGPNAGTGNIQGLPSTPVGGAGISWVNGQSTFQFLVDAGTVGANIDAGTVILRYPGSYPTPAGTNFIALQVPPSISSGYAITLPAVLPGSQLLVQMGSTGQLVNSNTVLGGLNIGSGGANLTNSGTALVLGGGLYPGGTANAKLAPYTSNALSIQDNAGLNDRTILVTNPSTSGGLLLVRGVVATGATIISGEGFSVSRPSAGVYTITFSPAFLAGDTPAITATTTSGAALIATISSVSNSVATLFIQTTSNSLINSGFSFIAVGQRS